MSSRAPRRRLSFSVRLTLWYGLLAAASSLAIAWAAYVLFENWLSRHTDAGLRADIMEFMDVAARRKTKILQSDFDRWTRFRGVENAFCRLVSPAGEQLAASNLDAWPDLALLVPPLEHAEPGEPVFGTVRMPGRGRRVRVACAKDWEGRLFQVGHSLRHEDELSRALRLVLALGMAGSLCVGTAAAFLMVRSAMRRVEAVRQTAMAVAAGDLAQRVPTRDRDDEIGRLASAFNAMLERIGCLVSELKTMSDNVAHDFQSPLGRLRCAAETALTGGGGLEDYREMARLVVEECDRLSRMVRTMLEIARAEGGLSALVREDLSLSALVKDACELFAPSAEDKGIRMSCELPDGDVGYRGDRSALQRVIANLVDNAVKYTPSGGAVNVCCAREGAGARISVRDTGVGIDAAHLPRIFERFFQVEGSRASEGAGLGLPLVQALVKAHGGSVRVESAVGVGSTFHVVLPAGG